MTLYQRILEAEEEKEALLLVTILEATEDQLVGKRVLFSVKGILYQDLSSRELLARLEELALPLLKEKRSTLLAVECGEVSCRAFFDASFFTPRLLIFGGGHVGAALAQMAAPLDFEVTVFDDRPHFASNESHPMAERVICGDYEEIMTELKLSENDYLVVVTRGHQYDRLCLEALLGSRVAYLGMIGSKRKVRLLFEALLASGFSRAALKGVSAPIGLDIGAETPEEIALSILVEIVRTRRKGSYYFHQLKTNQE